MNKLQTNFIEELKDIYDAEHQLTKALPKMAEAAQNDELKTAIESHLGQTQGHVERLERVFAIVGEKPAQKKCKAMAGLIAENEEAIKGKKGDAMLIAGGQKVEHYEISAYGTLVAWAKFLKEKEAAHLLEQTLEEEKSTDEKLTNLAEGVINADASAEAK